MGFGTTDRIAEYDRRNWAYDETTHPSGIPMKSKRKKKNSPAKTIFLGGGALLGSSTGVLQNIVRVGGTPKYDALRDINNPNNIEVDDTEKKKKKKKIKLNSPGVNTPRYGRKI